MNNRPHWSYSAISQFLACPLRYYFQRVIGLPDTTVSSGLVLGSAVHHALAEYHRGIQARQPVNKDHLHDALVKGWEHLSPSPPPPKCPGMTADLGTLQTISCQDDAGPVGTSNS
jgi:hypothetical protein